MAKRKSKKKSGSKGRSRKPKKSATKRHLAFTRRTHAAVRSHLSAAVDLPTFLATAGALSLASRKKLIAQALLLIEQNYVHLPLKEAMHGVDPLQRLRLIQHRLDQVTSATMGSEHEFHREVVDVFNSVRDLHTNYLLPAPFNNTIAFMPFDIEEYFEDGKPHYVATHFIQGFQHQDFVPGVEVTLWNGVPIRRAIEANAARHAGSNLAARYARGIQGLTIRPLVRSLPPDELWVKIGYVDLDGTAHELHQDWLVSPPLPVVDGIDADSFGAAALSLGLDVETDLIRQMKTMLFAPKVIAAARKPQKKRLAMRRAAAGEAVTTTMEGVFSARSVTTASGEFGYIRIFTFNVNDPVAFVDEFARLAGLLPQNGLIIDVRGNGGGHIYASEGLLQLLTPRTIEPEPTQFINTPLNLRICRRHENNPTGEIDLTPWVESIRKSVETGAVYSRAFPITPMDFANRWGQRYHGPSVLITDALCYSATDIFAAGFQDHEIGPILGVADNTGAGGANVWTHGLLQALLRLPSPPDPDSPYENLPNGAGLRVSIRQTLRVRARSGTPLEDLGVVPEERHQMTKNDLLNSNEDLIESAGKILKDLPVRTLSASVSANGSELDVDVTTGNLSRIDVYIDGRPVTTLDVVDGTHELTLTPPQNAVALALAGFHGNDLVAARRVTL